MATRYWVGGTGDWTDTAHWSTSSGGSGGASEPTSSDDVIFNSSSGGGTITSTGGVDDCLTLNTTGFTGTFSNISLNVHGSVMLGTGATHTGLQLTFYSTATLATNGETIAGLTAENASSVTMVGALTCSGTLNVHSGTLLLKHGVTSSCGGFSSFSNGSLASTSAGSQATLSDSSGTNTLTSITVQDIAFTGGATWAAGSGYVDGGNNTGITSSSVPILFFGGEA